MIDQVPTPSKKEKKYSWSSGHKANERVREFRFLNVGEPYSEIRIIKGRDIDKAVTKFKDGGGRKITEEELKEWSSE